MKSEPIDDHCTCLLEVLLLIYSVVIALFLHYCMMKWKYCLQLLILSCMWWRNVIWIFFLLL